MAELLTVQGELLGTHVHHQVLDGLFVKRTSAIVADVSSAVEEAFDTCASGWYSEKIACQATPSAEATQLLDRLIASRKYAAQAAGLTPMSVAETDVLWYRRIDLGSAVDIGESPSSGNPDSTSMFHHGIESTPCHQKPRAYTAGQASSPWRTGIHGPGKSCHSIPLISV
ncbi:hypothetical protein BDV41DRAFT_569476 [Aspergillus transmontanensis]|uniref:Uncharacterized protein n=1 Tax=Aspergillus transmontanensis TaxID=1034304 RepID=A0A5N6VEJ5_9EURO|nr:hypothetical protein BDV41DRAFT_569476 [Aspergillus transmontanensis]